MAKKPLEALRDGILNDNPSFVQVIGMCPTLAVTTNAVNGICMGIATTFVLVCSNTVISLIRNVIPEKVRIPAYIVVIATFVTVIEFILKAYFLELNKALGIFIPLIVVNCIIFARAESFAGKNKPIPSLFDGIGIGLGFTAALTLMGIIREFLGSGTFFGMTALPEAIPRTVFMILPPGAFITLAVLIACFNHIRTRRDGRIVN